MAWYEKGKVPEWRSIVDRPYTPEALIANKDLLLQELSKAEELQGFLRANRDAILSDLLRFCLQPPPESSCYDRKYAMPTRAVQLMTHDVFFGALGLQGDGVGRYVQLMMEYFLGVNPHKDNINLHHAYFERLLRMLVGCRTLDKSILGVAIEQQQARSGFLDKLHRHSHKLSVSSCIDIMLTLDLVEPNVALSLPFKHKIISMVFQTVAEHVKDATDAERTENCLQVLKAFFEKGINFLAGKRNIPETPLTAQKSEAFLQLYSHFQANFSCITALITSQTQSCIKIIAFELLQLNQILLSQPEARHKQLSTDWALTQSHSLIAYMLGSRVSIVHPVFVDWLTISFAQIGQQEAQMDLLRSFRVVESVIGMMLANRNNNILNAKIFQFLKIIFHNVAEGEVIACIDKCKPTNPNPTNTPSSLKLMPYFLQNLNTLETTVRQFRSINEPLFVTLFTLFKVISQYCQNIDSIFNLYSHLDICKANRTAVARVIEFQSNEQCFMVFEREAAKDLGKFYADDMFINQKPVQFTVKPLPSPPLAISTQPASPFEAQTFIKIPFSSSAVPPPPPQEEKQPIVIAYQSKSQTLIPEKEKESPCIKIPSIVQPENEEDQTSDPAAKFGSYMREKLKEVEANIHERRSKSRTPTKIKSEAKKSKKWDSNADQSEEKKGAFSSEVKERPRSMSTPKLTRALIECKNDRIALIKISNKRIPRPAKERVMNNERDGRLIGWLAALRA